ncbi:MAG: diacylglycerol kinase [Patescibacteria group bacterium]
MNFRKLGKSIGFAWQGIVALWRGQQNFRIEIGATVFILAMTYVFHVGPVERGIIILMILLVLAAEIMNSVFENILDGISTKKNEKFRVAKDIMAGMVLIMAMGAVAVAVIIFYPYVRYLLVG